MSENYFNFCKITLIFFSICVSNKVLAKMTTYLVTPIKEELFSACEEYPNNFLSEVLDLSNISYTYLENYSLLVTGTVRLTTELPQNEKIVLNVQNFVRRRGQWVMSMHTIYRDDFCKSFYDPTEIWYQWTKTIEVDSNACPPTLGLNKVIDAKVSFPQRNLDGDYKIQITLRRTSDPNKFVCCNLLVRVDKA